MSLNNGARFGASLTVLFICALVLGAAGAPKAQAGVIALFTDVESMGNSTSGRNQLLDNLLGDGTRVLYSVQSSVFGADGDIDDYYNSLSGVTANKNGAELDSLSLTNTDLIVLGIGCCSSEVHRYDAAEIAAINAFLADGKRVGIVVEPCCGTDATTMNQLLTDIGSSMQISDTHTAQGDVVIDTSTFLGAGVSGYAAITFNSILGGTAVVTQGGSVSVAFDGVLSGPQGTGPAIPGPAAILLIVTGIAALRWLRAA